MSICIKNEDVAMEQIENMVQKSYQHMDLFKVACTLSMLISDDLLPKTQVQSLVLFSHHLTDELDSELRPSIFCTKYIVTKNVASTLFYRYFSTALMPREPILQRRIFSVP